ncbi:MAG: hypothetical protein LBE62_04010 [Azonexus sp.]|jgi:hypothetical protein|nr:hypothetical protein [Azonexus sp.]
MKNFFLCLLVCLFATGCQTTSLDKATIFYERATFPDKLQRDTGIINEPIVQHGRCSLYLGTPSATHTTNFRFCTYALTEQFLLIQEWDIANAKYTQFMRIDFAQLTSVDLASFIRSKQVKMRETQRLVGISAIIDEGGYIDGDATERIFQAIKAQGIPSVGDDKLLSSPPAAAPAMIIIPRTR